MNALEYDRSHVWHPYASLKNPPPVRLAAGAEGVEIVLADGRRLVDAVSSWWCVAHGHNHPAIVSAIRKQSESLCHVMFGGFTHAPAVELAERLASIAPPGMDKVFFADSGSISVEVAVKMAIQYQQAKGRPSRGKMVALKGGYHGDTACAMALSDPDGMHVLFRGMMPRHPSQLYEALLEGLLLFILLYALSRKAPARPRGTFLGVFLVVYAICRFAMEFVRQPDVQIGYLWGGWLTMGQCLSVPLLVAGVCLLVWACKRKLPQQGLPE